MAASINIRGSRSSIVSRLRDFHALGRLRETTEASAQSCVFRRMSPGQDGEQNNVIDALASTDATSSTAGGSLSIGLVCTHAVFDVVVDDKIQFLFIKSEMGCQQSVNVVDQRLRTLNFEGLRLRRASLALLAS